MDYAQKVNDHLDRAITREREGDIAGAERSFKLAAFNEAKRLGLPPVDYVAACCPAY